jgi:hypothetical protein
LDDPHPSGRPGRLRRRERAVASGWRVPKPAWVSPWRWRRPRSRASATCASMEPRPRCRASRCAVRRSRRAARRPVRVCRGTHPRLCAWDRRAPGRYQSGGALTVAGLATLLANALPIVAAATVLGEPVSSGPLGLRYALSIARHRPVGATTCRSQLSAPRRGLPSSAVAERVELGVHRSNFELRGPWSQSQVRMPERRGILIATRPAICLSAMQRDPRVMNRPAMRQRDK